MGTIKEAKLSEDRRRNNECSNRMAKGMGRQLKGFLKEAALGMGREE